MIAFNPLALLPLAKKVIGYFGVKRDQKHAWEVAQAKRSTTLLRVLSFVTIWGPIYHAYYLAMTTATIESPDDVASAVKATFNAFPGWWTGTAVTILLAVWGIREATDASIVRSAVKASENRTEAAKELQKRKNRVAEPPHDRR